MAASLILLTLVAGVIGTTWGLIRAEQQRIIVERQRDELADRNQALQAAHERERLLNERARQAIETVTSDQTIDQLTRVPELRPEQKEFLDKMIQYYAESSQDVPAPEQARTYYRMGRMNQILGRAGDSENAYLRALAIGRKLASDNPTKPEFRRDLALSHIALGTLLSATRKGEAEAAYTEALTILKQLAAEFPTQTEFRQVLAGVHNNLGNVFYETGRLKAAEDAQLEALAIRKQLPPNGTNIRRALAMSHNNLGWLFQITERLPQAEAAFREAVAAQRQQVAEANKPEFRLELGKYLFNLAHVLRDTARSKEAETVHAEGLAIYKELVAEFPNRPEFRKEFADAVGHEPQPITGSQGVKQDRRGTEGEEQQIPGALGGSGSPKK